jgi:LysM repeat protein
MLKIKINSSDMKYNLKSVAKFALILTLSTFHLSTFAKKITVDSVAIRKEGNKTYIIHKVEPRQTLYAVLRKYGSTMSDFHSANPGVSENVNIGQLIKIPYYKPYVASQPSQYSPFLYQPSNQPTQPVEQPKAATHVVEYGQGLYGIAAKYRVSVADIRKWNNLASDQLSAGQLLIIDAKEYERVRRLIEPPVRNTDVPRGNVDAVAVEVPKYKSVNKNEEATVADVKTSSEVVRTASGYKRTIETGLAELIDVEDNSGKYLALHRSAGIGTLLNVKNIANGQSIWVKVVGKLPDIGSDKVILKLSPRAFEKLNPTEKRIRAEVNYMTP